MYDGYDVRKKKMIPRENVSKLDKKYLLYSTLMNIGDIFYYKAL